MSGPLLHNKLQVLYCVLQQGETATVRVSGTTAGDSVHERWPAWLSMTRIQWFLAWLEGEQLDWALLQQLRRRWRWIVSPCSGRGWC